MEQLGLVDVSDRLEARILADYPEEEQVSDDDDDDDDDNLEGY